MKMKKNVWALQKGLVGAVLIGLCVLISAGTVSAGEFRASGGEFSINLPNGWELKPQMAPTVFVFQGKGVENIIVEYFADEKDVNTLLEKGLTTAKAGGIGSIRVEDMLSETTVNGRPGAWGYYTGVFTQNNALLNIALGAVALPKGGIYFVSILNDSSKKAMGPAIEKAFWTIR